jgi:hypothetical protein
MPSVVLAGRCCRAAGLADQQFSPTVFSRCQQGLPGRDCLFLTTQLYRYFDVLNKSGLKTAIIDDFCSKVSDEPSKVNDRPSKVDDGSSKVSDRPSKVRD